MRRVSVILVLCMFLGLLAASGMTGHAQADTASNYKAGDIVVFGSYPQTQVTDTSLVTKLKNEVKNKTFTAYPYTSRNEDYDNVYGTSRMVRNYDMMSYCDFSYNGKKYRAVTIKQQRPDYAWGKPGSNSYMSVNGYEAGNTYFFRWEPIRWVVLDPGQGILLSLHGIDGQEFCEMCKHGNNSVEYSCLNTAAYANDYAFATIREWLTVPEDAHDVYKQFNFLHTAFSNTEIMAIRDTEINSFSTGKKCFDKVYLLSKTEFEAYKSVSGVTDNVTATDYAKSQGSAKAQNWTLRTQANGNSFTSVIMYASRTSTSSSQADFASMYSGLSLIRPAVKVDLSNGAVRLPKLDTPSGVSGQFSWDTSKWEIRWNGVEEAEQYIIYRKVTGSNAWEQYTTVNASGQTCIYNYPMSSISGSDTHKICIVAAASGGIVSDQSSEVSVTRMGRIRFDLNGGTSGAPSTAEAREGAVYYFPAAMPQRDGYECLGWATSKSATKADYTGGSSLVFNGDKILYAVWKRKGVTITEQPSDKTAIVGTNARFTVQATGTGTLKYQWQYRKNESSEWNPSGQSGNKTATLSVATTVGLHGYQFRCIVTDNYGQAISKIVTLKLRPKFTTQPEDTTVTVGSAAVFTVEATGKSTLRYQWQYRKDGDSSWTKSGQSGNTTATLSVKTTAGLHGYQFRCAVMDGNYQTTFSKVVTLTLKPKITTWPKDTTAAPGTTAKFTVAATGKGTLKYQWQYRKNETGEWKDSGQSGNKTATLSVAVTAGLNGYQFRCYVTDANGQKSYTNTVTLTVSPRITTQPVNKTVTAGTAAKFTVVAAGKATLTYQWQYRRNSSDTWKNSGQSGNKTATLSVATTKGLNGYQFRCIVKDGDGRQTISGTVTLTVK